MIDITVLPLEWQPIDIETEEVYTDPGDSTKRTRPIIVRLANGYELQPTGGISALTPNGDKVDATHIMIGLPDALLKDGAFIRDTHGQRFRINLIQDWVSHYWIALERTPLG